MNKSTPSIRVRSLRALAAITLAALSLTTGANAVAADLVFAISEGSSGGTDHGRVIAKYQGLAQVLGKAIGQKVNVVFVREFKFLEDGLQKNIYDLAMARPSDYPARGMRDYGYQYVASAKPEGRCLIIVPKDAPIERLDQIKGKRIALPSPAAYMTKFCTAMLRSEGIDVEKETVTRVREQGAVPFFLNNRFADVGGVASYSGVAKRLEQDNMRILHASIPQPYFPMVASSKLKPEQVKAMQGALAQMESTAEGRKVLATIGIEGFDTGTEQRLKELLGWLGQ
ncbi:PhnD/SsuA/transferrin family substrate-binding protein [Hydrogenophaga sp. 5NK40-0174]|uniref:phosphate/phosphite/phosphonate ABC transporter substrate-binding protein n=1 Tax=Hydrogenophaga sp. 5NK40-0174 TaxID=3127649 RepID=UPI00310B154B